MSSSRFSDEGENWSSAKLQRPASNVNREDRIANPVNRFMKEKIIWHVIPMPSAVSAAAKE
jgi:hypothetical protein